MKLTIRDIEIRVKPLRTRLPFKYGIATMVDVPHLFLKVYLEVDGTTWSGIAADHLPPKWFTKNPAKPVAEEVAEMLGVVIQAARLAKGAVDTSPFGLWKQVYQAQAAWALSANIPPLLAHFGTSLVERAVIEAFCRSRGKPFWQLLRDGELGLNLGEIHPSLRGREARELLGFPPLGEVTLRHTVGLADPLTEEEIPASERLDDGLPQALETAIGRYGLRQFKIKITGDATTDTDRLRRVAALLNRTAGPEYRFSLDGNEQFKSMAAFRATWEDLQARPELAEFFARLLFVEQPVHRDFALGAETEAAFAGWKNPPPIIIDESDGDLGSVPRALEIGYRGASHKNCKGIFKGVANRCLLAAMERDRPGQTWLMTGEDLCNIGPIAQLQDLAVMAALGIGSVERNGHHYFPGISMFSRDIQALVVKNHPDLYEWARPQMACLKIVDGKIAVGSLNTTAFGPGFGLPLDQFEKLEY